MPQRRIVPCWAGHRRPTMPEQLGKGKNRYLACVGNEFKLDIPTLILMRLTKGRQHKKSKG